MAEMNSVIFEAFEHYLDICLLKFKFKLLISVHLHTTAVQYQGIFATGVLSEGDVVNCDNSSIMSENRKCFEESQFFLIAEEHFCFPS